MSLKTAPAPSLSKRKRDFVRTQASAAVLALVLERGYESITVDDMAEAAGLGRRTFFRYFEGKEDALFVAVDAAGDQLAAGIEEQPKNQAVWDAIRGGVLKAFAQAPDSLPSRELVKLLYESPALRTRHLDKQDRWRKLLTGSIAARLSGAGSRHKAELLAGVAMAALDSALTEWYRSRTTLSSLIEQAFEDARPAAAR